MNLQDMRAFVAFAETGSMVRAAHYLHLTQPATTRRIQRFEAAIGGTALLDRSVKPPVLTSNGRQVLERCRTVLSSLRDLATTADSSSMPVGEFRIGVAQGLGDLVLGAPLDAIRRRFPGLVLSVTSNWSASLVKEVRAGALDCAVGVLVGDSVAPSGIDCVTVGHERLVAVAARDFQLPRRPRGGYTLGHLQESHWVLHPQGCAYRALLEAVSNRAGLPLRIAAEVYERDLRMSLIARGLGLGLVTPRYLKASRLQTKLRVIELTDFTPRISLTMFGGHSLGAMAAAVENLSSAIVETLDRENKKYA